MPKQTKTTTKPRRTTSAAAKKPAKRAPRRTATTADIATSVLSGASKERITASFLRRGR